MEFNVLLQRILDRPRVYVGNHSIERIGMFIGGYATCLHDQGMKLEYGERTFLAYVQEKYGITSHNWDRIIQFYSSSEEEAFDVLVQLFDEYKRSIQ